MNKESPKVKYVRIQYVCIIINSMYVNYVHIPGLSKEEIELMQLDHIWSLICWHTLSLSIPSVTIGTEANHSTSSIRKGIIAVVKWSEGESPSS